MNVMTSVIASSSDDPKPFKLRIEDYELLDRAGAFDRTKVELIDGRIILVNAQRQAHLLVKNHIGFRLQTALKTAGSALDAMIEGSVALSPNDLPDPDIIVARFSPVREYVKPEQVAIVVEVADTTLRHDLGAKRDLYAFSGVPEYWVVDVNGNQVHQFWSPSAGAYNDSRTVRLGGELRSATIPDLAIDGSGIL